MSRRPRGRPPAPPSQRALRVVAGELAGRRFDAPVGHETRPTADRVRQATFNALDSLGAVAGARVLDAFAGSGALGIEALSRGADHVTFVELDGPAAELVARNLSLLGLAERATVRRGDALGAGSVGGPYDLVLLDPPYAWDRWDELLVGLLGALAPEALVVIESDRSIALPEGLDGVREKTYGGTVVQFTSPTGAPP